ncbi:MAG TPA: 6-carboxytetrahydropterin synthase [Chitinophagaceae bacterium]|nr:6-carboxytetrahydropterin synthase [Chitinophagaceae bacterium]
MDTVRITKIFKFEMGHALVGYDGKCANIHGHSYRLEVTLIGQPEKNPDSAKLGMVLDFSDLKNVINKEVIDRLDHALVLKEEDRRAELLTAEENLILVPYQPTCENLLIDIIHRIQMPLSKLAKLYSVILHETATSKAAWYATDN